MAKLYYEAEFLPAIPAAGKLLHYVLLLVVKKSSLILSLMLLMDSFYQFVLMSIL